MFAYSPLQVLVAIWVAVAVVYLVLFLFRSVVGMKEEDTLFLSAGESRMAAEQQEILKRLAKIDPLIKWSGWATLALTVIVGGVWGYSIVKVLF